MSDPSNTVAFGSELPLAGQTVLVTGPDGTLAGRIARAAADCGARVGLATATRVEVGPADGIAHFPVTLLGEGDADRLFDAIVDRLSHLDIVIAVVAADPLGALHEVSPEQWRHGVTGPLRQLFWLARRAVEECLAGGAATRIVLLPDPDPAGARNEVVEDALRSFARSLAREYGSRSLACNVIVPVRSGGTAGGLARQSLDAIVEHVLFLASPAASFVNGETLLVEGRGQREERDGIDEP
jgi:3-oxoacyl-[acyl-carrier protein] reductase/2-deoxy-D-gluconate 3-dehydrogenase